MIRNMAAILGAFSAALLTGGLAGAAINTRPHTSAADVMAAVPQHRLSAPAILPAGTTPNHYPLDTPHGRIEVAELSWHGRNHARQLAARQQRRAQAARLAAAQQQAEAPRMMVLETARPAQPVLRHVSNLRGPRGAANRAAARRAAPLHLAGPSEPAQMRRPGPRRY